MPVFPGREASLLSQTQSQEADAHVFHHISRLLNIHSYHWQFAQKLYKYCSGRQWPPKESRPQSPNLNRDAALLASHCLGHNRIDINFSHYIC